jgi:hypothetical protein
VKDPWDEEATMMEKVFTWLIQWGGKVFIALALGYFAVLLYFLLSTRL